MKRNKTIAVIATILLASSMMAFWTPTVSTTPQHRIVLPFHTSWQNEQALGSWNSVDWKTQDFYGYYGPDNPLQPELGRRRNEVSQGPDPPAFGYPNFGDYQEMAAGWFGSSYSYCYFNLFDETSDYAPPIKIREYTFINIWYYHDVNKYCMIDASLYNKNTKTYWTLRDFQHEGEYIVDQNGVRLHPACRGDDPIDEWQFVSFDLSTIYESDPGNWYIVRIWIAFDNDPSLSGEVVTGPARTYFDMLHISYGLGDYTEETYTNAYAQTTASFIAFERHGPRAIDGKYELYLKVMVRGAVTGYVYFWPGQYCYLYPYTLKVSTPIAGAEVLDDPPPTGANLTELSSNWTDVGLWIQNVVHTGLGFATLGATDILAIIKETYVVMQPPEPEPVYEWPHSWQWRDMTAYGEAYIMIPLDPGSFPVPITLSVEYTYTNIWGQHAVHDTHDITFYVPWSSEPDELNIPRTETIDTNYDGCIIKQSATYYKNWKGAAWYTGDYFPLWPPLCYQYRSFLRFPLDDIPSNADVTKVRFKCVCLSGGDSNHLIDIHAYSSDGSQNPESHTGVTLWNKCASGNLYVDNSNAFQIGGDKWFDLGSQACTDVENAISLGTTFTISLHEQGDNNGRASMWSSEKAELYPQYMPMLEVTYTIEGQ